MRILHVRHTRLFTSRTDDREVGPKEKTCPGDAAASQGGKESPPPGAKAQPPWDYGDTAPSTLDSAPSAGFGGRHMLI